MLIDSVSFLETDPYPSNRLTAAAGNHIKDEGCKVLADALRFNDTVKHVGLACMFCVAAHSTADRLPSPKIIHCKRHNFCPRICPAPSPALRNPLEGVCVDYPVPSCSLSRTHCAPLPFPLAVFRAGALAVPHVVPCAIPLGPPSYTHKHTHTHARTHTHTRLRSNTSTKRVLSVRLLIS